MRVSLFSPYEREIVRNKGFEEQSLWYLMRIVGNKSDILVQAVLDALMQKPGLSEKELKKTEEYTQGLDSAQLANYVYPKAVLRPQGTRRKAAVSPLMTGYMFCQAKESLLVNLVNRVPNFIFCYPRPMNETKRVVIPNVEMDNFIKALTAAAVDHSMQIIPYEEARSKLTEGTEVRFEGGSLHDIVGYVGKNASRNHLYITLGGCFTLDIKLNRTDKKVRTGGTKKSSSKELPVGLAVKKQPE